MARKVSISFNWQGPMDYDQALHRVRVAEDAGVDTAWVAEAWGRDCFTLLALMARETQHIQLGTGIVNTYSRTPAALAQHFATLDELSGGRMIIGLGTSGYRVIEHWHGIPFQPSLTRLREYAEIIRIILSGEPLQYRGKVFNLQRGFRLRFQPVRSQIPIFIASLTPKSVAQTARLADGWMPVLIPLPQLQQEVRRFRQLVQEAGRDPQSVAVRSPGAVTVTHDVEKARQDSKAHVAFYITNMGDYYREQLIRMGHEEAVTVVRHAWEEGGHAAGIAAVPDALVDSLFFAGPVEACVERLQAQAEAGIDLHTVNVAMEDPQEAAHSLAKLVG
ncbi:MAG: LLM class flavin-dependent oxidoreductase [Candidatus Tectomicrobia bacterium]|uniref:LLM class flavin-dependent oxidoreductase n=1 Tax=Tectimicrobiota bacterium TaxID=2528274 RepID=A0A937VZF5_UNCTE|nr:LLM class flavin-dependent oxidoreductase [Candidatus Tectomicrobia bacterium]